MFLETPLLQQFLVMKQEMVALKRLVKSLHLEVKRLKSGPKDSSKGVIKGNKSNMPEQTKIPVKEDDHQELLYQDKPNISLTSQKSSLFSLSKSFSKIGYITICSSVASSGRINKRKSMTDTSGQKSVLYGAADDIENFSKFLYKEDNRFAKQGKYEFSKESISSLSKEDFLDTLENFFNSPTNDGCIVFYSGHGLADTSLLFETCKGNYYINYFDIVKRWKNRNNRKNKHLLILLDCCYSGSWVNQIFESSDFSDLSILASSTSEQKSNDLGEGLGSLFTGLFIQFNTSNQGALTKLDLNENSVTEKLMIQTPRAFVNEEVGVGGMLFKNINFNSWQELFHEPSMQQVMISETIKLYALYYANENASKIFSCFPHLGIILKDDNVKLQAEIPHLSENHILGKVKVSISLSQESFSNLMSGLISIYSDLVALKGKFACLVDGKVLSFRLAKEDVDNCFDLLGKLMISFLSSKDNSSQKNVELEKELSGLIQTCLSSFTELNKNNLIMDLLDDLGDDEMSGPRDELEIKTGAIRPLKHLELNSSLSQEVERQLARDLENIHEIRSIKLGKPISFLSESVLQFGTFQSVKIVIERDCSSVLLSILENSNYIGMKEFSISFLGWDKIQIYPNLLSSITVSNCLTQFEAEELPIFYFKNLIEIVGIAFLTILKLKSTKLSREQATTLFKSLSINTSIKSISVIDCSVSEIQDLSPTVTTLDLQSNIILSQDCIKLIDTKLAFLQNSFTVNLSFNLLNNLCLASISRLLRGNCKCTEFLINGNLLLNDDIMAFTRTLTLQKNNIVTLNLSDLNLSSAINQLKEITVSTKQIKYFVIRNCMLVDDSLKSALDVMGQQFSNSITHIDASYNLITKISVLENLRRAIKFSLRIQSIKLHSVVRLELEKSIKGNIDMKGFLKNSLIEEIDISAWQCPSNVCFSYVEQNSEDKIASSLTNLFISGTNICGLDFAHIKLAILELDTLQFEIIPIKYCSKLILNDSCKTLDLLSERTLNKLRYIESLTLNLSTPIADQIITNYLMTMFGLGQEEQKLIVMPGPTGLPSSLSTLILEHTDGQALWCISDQLVNLNLNKTTVEFGFQLFQDEMSCQDQMEDLMQANSQFVSAPDKKSSIIDYSQERIDTNLIHITSLIPEEIIEKIYRRSKLLDISKYLFIEDLKTVIDPQTEILVLCRNFFLPESLRLTKLNNLKVLCLDSVYLPAAMPAIIEFCALNSKIETLIIKNSKISYKTICQLKDILLTIKDSFEELHLVSTFIESKTLQFFFNKLPEFKNWKVLNLSGNYVSLSLLIDIIKARRFQTVYLRDCNFSQQLVRRLFTELLISNHNIELLDLSGLIFKYEPIVQLSQSTDVELENYYSVTIFNTRVWIDLKFGFSLLHLHLYYVDFNLHKSDLNNLFKGCNKMRILKLTKCQNESDFVSTLEIMLRKSTIYLIDLSGNLMSTANSVALAKIIQNQNLVLGNKVKIDISDCQLIDKTFNIIFESILNCSCFDVSIANNHLTKFSYHYYLKERGNSSFSNLLNAFGGEFIESYSLSSKILNFPEPSKIERIPSIYKLPRFNVNTEFKQLNISGHGSKVSCLLKMNDDTIISGGYNSQLKVWRLTTKELLMTFEVSEKLGTGVLAKVSETEFAAGLMKNYIEIFSLAFRSCIMRFLVNIDSSICSMAILNPDALVCNYESSKISLWNIREGSCISTFAEHTNEVTCLYMFDDSTFLSGSCDCNIKIWTTNPVTCIYSINEAHKKEVSTLIRMFEDVFISGSFDNTVKGWSIIDFRNLWIIDGQEKFTYVLALTKVTDYMIAVGTNKKSLAFWKISQDNKIKSIMNLQVENRDGIRTLVQLSDGVVASNHNEGISIWNYKKSYKLKASRVIGNHLDTISGLIKLNEQLIASSSTDGKISVWNIKSRTCIQQISNSKVNAILKVNDQTFMTGGSHLKIWCMNSFMCLSTLPEQNEVVSLANVKFDMVAAGCALLNAYISIYQVSSRTQLYLLEGHQVCVLALVDFDNKVLISGSTDSSIKIWNTSDYYCKQTLDCHSNSVLCLEKIDKETFASGSDDHKVNIYRYDQEFLCTKTIYPESGSVMKLAKVSKSSIAIGTSQFEVQIWDLNTYECLSKTKSHSDIITSLLLFNEQYVISGSGDCDIRVSDISVHCPHEKVFTSEDLCLNLESREKIIVLLASEYSNRFIYATKNELRILDPCSSDEQVLDSLHNVTCIFENSWDSVLVGSDNSVIFFLNYINLFRLEYRGHKKGVTCIQKLSSSNIFASGSKDKSLKIWCITSGNCLHTFDECYTKPIACLLSLGDLLIPGSSEATINVFQVSSKSFCFSLSCDSGYNSISRLTDSIFITAHSLLIRIWNANTRAMINQIYTSDSMIKIIALNEEVILAKMRGCIKAWNVCTKLLLANYTIKSGEEVFCQADSCNGKRIIAVDDDLNLKIIKLAYNSNVSC